jgi:hypothetical protein
VHGCLHLAGLDHEQGGEQLRDMADAEAGILAALGWEGQGLIEAAGSLAAEEDEEEQEGDGSADSSSTTGGSSDDGKDDRGDSDDSLRAASGSQASASSAYNADSIITRTGG